VQSFCKRVNAIAKPEAFGAENDPRMRADGNANNTAGTETSNLDSGPCSPPTLVARATETPAAGASQVQKTQLSVEAKRGSTSTDLHLGVLQRQVEILKAEKATLLGELQRQKEIQCQQAQV
jgi:hypothetical protein